MAVFRTASCSGVLAVSDPGDGGGFGFERSGENVFAIIVDDVDFMGADTVAWRSLLRIEKKTETAQRPPAADTNFPTPLPLGSATSIPLNSTPSPKKAIPLAQVAYQSLLQCQVATHEFPI